MADRIVAIRGIAQGTEIAVSIDGTQVFSGAGQGLGLESDSRIATVTIDNDNTQNTNHSMSITCNSASGNAYVDAGMVQTNLLRVVNPALTPVEKAYIDEETTSTAPQNIRDDVLAKGGWFVISADIISDTIADSRSNFALDGVALDPQDYATEEFSNPFTGWTFKINPGQTLTFDFVLAAEGTPGI